MKNQQVKKSLTELSLSITPLKKEELAKVIGGVKREEHNKSAQRKQERARK
ncbi:hypothetical protein ACE193_00405 [Bernardetia sp. OM2101]|uniref:hypothetical protein n=1 Tax=Bernardetia sp. OM2101 TaxID=3344876 RepID=UPI0035CFBCB6